MAAHHTPSFHGELGTAAGGHVSWTTALAKRQWLQARTEIEITVTQIKNEVTAVDVSLTLDMWPSIIGWVGRNLMSHAISALGY